MTGNIFFPEKSKMKRGVIICQQVIILGVLVPYLTLTVILFYISMK